MDTEDLSQPASALSFATWSAPETPLVVECTLPVLEELRSAAWEGLQALLRGGLEVGGILFGTVGQNRIRITAWRPIGCEHAQGPTFTLSQKDRAALARLLESSAADPDLRGLQPVGLLVSHTRSSVRLSPSDLDIYSTFFPASWQVALVVRPEKLGICRAGFFVRDADGRVRSDSSYREFALEPMSLPALAPALEPPPGSARRLQPIAVPDLASFAPPPQPLLRKLPPKIPAPATAPNRRPKWIWALLACAVVLIAGAVFYFGRFWEPGRSFSLRATDHDGQLRLEWDRDSPSILSARGSSIELADNGSTQRFSLSSVQLQEGAFNYVRQSGQVTARMMVLRGDGSSVEETVNFAGPPPPGPVAPPREVQDLRSERDQLKAEVQRLRDQTQKKRVRSRKR